MDEAPQPPPPVWTYVGHCVESQAFLVEGIDVWSHEWTDVPGLVAEVKDPLYAQDYRFPVYEILSAGRVIRFAAGEYSACVFGFYVPRDP
jgi:hypothetical protein